jgi:hypothetical protein
MIEYIGNCSQIIDWDEIIKQCASTTPEYIGPSHKKSDDIPGLKEVSDLWDHAGYKNLNEGGTVGWSMYLPGKQFDSSAIDKFCKIYNIETYRTAWISRIDVGHFAPIHWDVNDQEEQLSKLPPMVRYHCHISKPKFGHVFIVEDQCFYNKAQGDTFKWADRRYWHAGSNCGLEPKYILNLW